MDVVHIGVGDIIDKWSPFYTQGQERGCFPASASYENTCIRSLRSEHWNVLQSCDEMIVEAKRMSRCLGSEGIRIMYLVRFKTSTCQNPVGTDTVLMSDDGESSRPIV